MLNFASAAVTSAPAATAAATVADSTEKIISLADVQYPAKETPSAGKRSIIYAAAFTTKNKKQRLPILVTEHWAWS